MSTLMYTYSRWNVTELAIESSAKMALFWLFCLLSTHTACPHIHTIAEYTPARSIAVTLHMYEKVFHHIRKDNCYWSWFLVIKAVQRHQRGNLDVNAHTRSHQPPRAVASNAASAREPTPLRANLFETSRFGKALTKLDNTNYCNMHLSKTTRNLISSFPHGIYIFVHGTYTVLQTTDIAACHGRQRRLARTGRHVETCGISKRH